MNVMGGQLHRGRRHSSRRSKQKIVCNKPFTATLCVYFFVCGVFLFLFQLSIPQCLSDTKCLSNFSMHHIFPKNAPVVRGKEHQIKSTAKSRTFSILSPSKHASVFHIRLLGVSQYHRSARVLSQHSLPSDNCLPWKHGSFLNFFLIWLRTGSPPESSDPKPLAASCN